MKELGVWIVIASCCFLGATHTARGHERVPARYSHDSPIRCPAGHAGDGLSDSLVVLQASAGKADARDSGPAPAPEDVAGPPRRTNPPGDEPTDNAPNAAAVPSELSFIALICTGLLGLIGYRLRRRCK